MSKIYYSNKNNFKYEVQFEKSFEVDAIKCIDSKTLFSNFSDSLKFPGYFGKNWDAFNDCIGDLSWLGEGKILIVVKNIDSLLIKEKNRLETFYKIILETLNYNIQNRDKKEEFGEPTISFLFIDEKSEFSLLKDNAQHFPLVRVENLQNPE